MSIKSDIKIDINKDAETFLIIITINNAVGTINK